jgi:hypothetical protein
MSEDATTEGLEIAWPPNVGELLPRAREATGVRYKLETYSLATTHDVGGSKARGFELILGITIEAIDYLEAQIMAGILRAPISAIRDNAPYGINCVVDLPVRGIGVKANRLIEVRTAWELIKADVSPRLISAYIND